MNASGAAAATSIACQEGNQLMGESDLQLFGGNWTEQKLEAIDQYLRAYAKVLKNQPFRRIYIDAFAGTGYREQRATDAGGGNMFTELAESDPQRFLDGSARIALRVEPAFHRYIFVELHERRAGELERLRTEFPERASSIEIDRDDSNDAIKRICSRWDPTWRGVLFLDPFGMQVAWSTIQAVASTRKIDVWILFPFAVNRLLTSRLDDMQPGWPAALDKLFGTRDWQTRFYRQRQVDNIFTGPETVVEKSLTFKGLGAFYMERLRSIFPVVADNPRVLRNTRNQPLFQLYFAAANKGRGGQIALKIASHILDRI
jgi:three-Cys-motif partner protein